jgi:site-specific DNA-methyltransferase (adenine-specific)
MENKTYRMDCIELMNDMEDKSVDCILTDPPYFIPAVHYSTRTAFKRNFADLGILESWFKIYFKQAARIIKPDGTIYMFCDGQSYPLFFWYCYQFTKSVKPLIWDKQMSINGYEWRHQHEIILWANMPDKKPIPTGDGDILKCRAVPVGERQHPAQKPIELLELLINKSTKAGDLIFDPFAGSGSCRIACERTSRNFIGAELNLDYYTEEEKRTNTNETLF